MLAGILEATQASPAAAPPPPPPPPPPATVDLRVVLSGRPNGSVADSGPNPRFDWRVNGVLQGSAIEVAAVTADGATAEFTFTYSGTLASLESVGVDFLNYHLNGITPRELRVHSFLVEGATYGALGANVTRTIFGTPDLVDSPPSDALLWRNGRIEAAGPFTGTVSPPPPPPIVSPPPPPPAGPIDPNFFTRSRARIAPLLESAMPFWARPQFLRDRYVAFGGSDSNPGTLSLPYKTLGRALLDGIGTAIWVRGDGPIRGVVSSSLVGNPGAWTAIRGYPGERAVIELPLGNLASVWAWELVNITGDYWLIEGLAIDASRVGRTMYDGHTITSEADADAWYISKGGYQTVDPQNRGHNMGTALNIGRQGGGSDPGRKTHHIVIRDVVACNAPGAGIALRRCDWDLQEDNLVFNNARGSGWGQSGATNFAPEAVEDGNQDTYRKIMRRLVGYNNRQLVPSVHDGDTSRDKDGNAFLLDLSRRYSGDKRAADYQYRTLFESCLGVGAGGCGVATVNYDHADIIGNTLYGNNRSPNNSSGEIRIGWSQDDRVIGNLCIGTRQGGLILNSVQNIGPVTFSHNICHGPNQPQTTGSNQLFADPRFVMASVDPAVMDFRLQANSPALGHVHPSLRASLDLLRQSKTLPDAGALWRNG